MRPFPFCKLVCCFVFTFSTCLSYSQIRIACLGNSITQGKIDRKTDSIKELSYRPWLWEKFDSAEIKVDMVGYSKYFFTEDSGHLAPTPISRFSGKTFDRDNDAYYGITSGALLNGSPSKGWTGAPLPKLIDRMNDTKRGYTADIALLHIGTNDADSIVGTTVQSIESIIDVLRSKNGKVVVFVARLITGWKAINKHIDQIVAAKSTSESPVIAVDLTTGFINDPKLPNTHTFDFVHPNVRGQQFMAHRWFNAIMLYLKQDKKAAKAMQKVRKT